MCKKICLHACNIERSNSCYHYLRPVNEYLYSGVCGGVMRRDGMLMFLSVKFECILDVANAIQSFAICVCVEKIEVKLEGIYDL